MTGRDLDAGLRYAPAWFWGWRYETVVRWHGEDHMTAERPDPLAPLPPRAPRDSSPASQLSGVCATVGGTGQCDHPVAVVWWIGCTRGEHAGPVEYCACCAERLVGAVLSCGQCRRATGCAERVQVLRITAPDGVTPAGQGGLHQRA